MRTSDCGSRSGAIHFIGIYRSWYIHISLLIPPAVIVPDLWAFSHCIPVRDGLHIEPNITIPVAPVYSVRILSVHRAEEVFRHLLESGLLSLCVGMIMFPLDPDNSEKLILFS